MTTPVELRLPADPAFVGLVRLVVVTAARQVGMAPDRLEDLRLAVSEATTNAILAHQRSGRGDEPVTVSLDPSSLDGFTVTIRDRGPGFEPGAAMDLSARDWSSEGGLGVTLIRGLADDCEFQRDDGMVVRLVFDRQASSV